MPVLTSVAFTVDVDPVVSSVGGFHNQLVKVGAMLKEVEPLLGKLHVGVTLVVVPI